MDDSLEIALERCIKLDSNDFSSKNRLRLLRIVRELCSDDALLVLASMVVCGLPVETLQYALFGFEKHRASLSDLIDPEESLIAKCQQELLLLALDFAPDSPTSAWRLLHCFALECQTTTRRLLCRKQLLQISAGLLDVFELKMAGPPYNLTWCAHDKVDKRTKREIVDDFFRIPEECLPFLCVQLRRQYPTPDAMLLAAPLVLQALSQSCPIAIDFSERCHAAMRRDLTAVGPATDFLAAADRLLVRQAVAAHLDAGGRDPATCRVVDMGAEPRGPSARQGVGSNPFLEFHNARFRTEKTLQSPHAPLAPAAREAIEDKIRAEWARIQDVMGSSADQDRLRCACVGVCTCLCSLLIITCVRDTFHSPRLCWNLFVAHSTLW